MRTSEAHRFSRARSRSLPADGLVEIARRLAASRHVWDGLVRTDGSGRDAVRLLSDCGYDAWLIGWPPRHRTTPHDHGGSTGAVVVVEGVLEEHTIDFGVTSVRHLHAGDATWMPGNVVHDVMTTEGTATSIHVYSPALTAMTFYESVVRPTERLAPIDGETPALAGTDLRRLLADAMAARCA